MRLDAFYHIWADGSWQQPLEDFRTALERSNFAGKVHYVVVGSPEPNAWREHGVYAETTHAKGNEYLTINALREYAQEHDGAILYAHTKGAYQVTSYRARWRLSMTRRVVGQWARNLAYLDSGEADAVGCHWLTAEEYPGMLGPDWLDGDDTWASGCGFFGGNFWMATCEYLRGLPPCQPVPRSEAEIWIGRGRPRVVDLLPGWPDDNRWPELCA